MENELYTNFTPGNTNTTISTINAIDITNYNKLIFKGQYWKHSSYGGLSFGLSNSKTSGQSGAVKQISGYRPDGNSEWQDVNIELDISGVTGSYWVFVRAYYGPCRIYEMYFE